MSEPLPDTAITTLLGTVSHEFRTPLNAILGLTTLVLDTPLDDEQREMLTTAQQAATSLLHLVNDLLDFSSIDAHQLTLEIKPFCLSTLIEQAVSVVQTTAAAKEIDILVSAFEEPDAYYLGAPARIGQIITNLLANALKFTEDGFIVVETKVKHTQAGCRVQIAITDTGIGIPRAAQRRIFEPFHQVDGSRKRREGGVGLGLAICHSLATLMGGTLTVRSKLGQGSTFTLTIPLQPTLAPLPSLVPETEDESILLKPLHVLVAEDNPLNQRLLRAMLERLGCSVECVSDGDRVLSALERTPFDLILMDCYMPKRDGIETTACIRRGNPLRASIPIVALTASALTSDSQRCFDAGVDELLLKPVSQEQLLALLRRYSEKGALLSDLTELTQQELARLLGILESSREDPKMLGEALHALAGIFLVLDAHEALSLVRQWEQLAGPERVAAWESLMPQLTQLTKVQINPKEPT